MPVTIYFKEPFQLGGRFVRHYTVKDGHQFTSDKDFYYVLGEGKAKTVASFPLAVVQFAEIGDGPPDLDDDMPRPRGV